MRFLALLLSCAVAQAELIQGMVELSGLKGEVIASQVAGAEPRALHAGDALHEDEVLTTAADGGAELVFSNGLRIVIAPSTTIRLSMFRQVKKTAPSGASERGEGTGDASVVDLDLRSGRMVVVAPPLSTRSLVSVKVPEGRMELAREGIYELSSERVASGERVAQSVVLAGSLKFSPVNEGRAAAVAVEAGSRLQVTADASANRQLVVEKSKMDKPELEARLKRVDFDPQGEVPPVVVPVSSQVTPPPAPTYGSRTELSRSEEAVQQVTQQVIERVAQTNPSPTGG
jgi:hypothetical protein